MCRTETASEVAEKNGFICVGVKGESWITVWQLQE